MKVNKHLRNNYKQTKDGWFNETVAEIIKNCRTQQLCTKRKRNSMRQSSIECIKSKERKIIIEKEKIMQKLDEYRQKRKTSTKY